MVSRGDIRRVSACFVVRNPKLNSKNHQDEKQTARGRPLSSPLIACAAMRYLITTPLCAAPTHPDNHKYAKMVDRMPPALRANPQYAKSPTRRSAPLPPASGVAAPPLSISGHPAAHFQCPTFATPKSAQPYAGNPR